MKLWNYVRGYVIIVVEGYFLEKFINICTHRQIYLWDVKIQNNCTMILKVSINGFKQTRHVAHKSNCRIKIRRKIGLPFILHRYRKRKALFIGLLIFIAILYVLTSFIWTIDIKGNKIIPSQHIIDNLASLGLRTGVPRYGIDVDRIINNMEVLIDDIGWIGISIKGTKAEIQIVERVRMPEIVEKDKPCDIVASNDGIVTDIIVKAGVAAVKQGDTVKKGQVLVSSIISGKYEGQPSRLVHSIATIKARTWYEEFETVKNVIINSNRTGKRKKRYSILFFNKRFNLYRARVPFEKSEQQQNTKLLSIYRDMQIPIGIIINDYYEIKDVEVTLSDEQAYRLAADKAIQAATDKLPTGAIVARTDVNFVEQTDGCIVADVVIECIEDIGIQMAK